MLKIAFYIMYYELKIIFMHRCGNKKQAFLTKKNMVLGQFIHIEFDFKEIYKGGDRIDSDPQKTPLNSSTNKSHVSYFQKK